MNSEKERFQEALRKRVLVLDGAMGTLLHSDCCDMLSVTQPASVENIHKLYLQSGADIITTNTFNANTLLLAKNNLSGYADDICTSAVNAARKAVDEYSTEHQLPHESRPFIAGSMGPTCISFAASHNPESFDNIFRDAAAAYRQQAGSLIRAGIEILLVETLVCTADIKAATDGINLAMKETGKDVAIMFSATLSKTGQMLSGETIEDYVNIASAANPVSIGLNCGYGMEHLAGHIERLADLAPCYISIHPNAGIPDETGLFRDSPDDFCRHLRPLIDNRVVNIVGGCCGTNPDYIQAIANLVK